MALGCKPLAANKINVPVPENALYFRYKCIDIDELKPNKLWDAFLFVSVLGMFAVGIWTISEKFL